MNGRKWPTSWAVLGLVLILPAPGGCGSALRVERQFTLPEELRWVLDVRWEDDDRILLSGEDVTEATLLEDGLSTRVLIPNKEQTPDGISGIGMGAALAVADREFVAGAIAFEIVWLSGETKELRKVWDYEDIEDIDAFDGRLAVLGLQRSSETQMAADGAIAWISSFDDDLGNPRPVLYSVTGPGARPQSAS